RSIPLEHYGLEWIHSPAALAHAIGDTAAVLEPAVEATAAGLGKDHGRYRRVFGPLARNWEALFEEVMQPVFHVPRHPFLLARFGPMAMLSSESFARGFFRDPKTRALVAGCSAHANVPLDRSGTASIAIMLMLAAHARGWPIPKGGSASIAKAMASYFTEQGGMIEANREVHSLVDLPEASQVFFDLPPLAIKSILEMSNEHELAGRFEPRAAG
ncbi:MAG: FAD-dependent oxidoreductase, partial [Bdellovibrionota bacterium]